MLETIYYVAASLDGYIATTDGGVEWLLPFQQNDEDHGFVRLYSSIDVMLMGSRTYEFAMKFPQWPTPDKPSWVFTRRPLPVVHSSVTLTAQDPSQVVEALGARGFSRAWLMGGGELASAFRLRGLISQYVISVIPVVLGRGVPLFASAARSDSLRLIETKSFPSGIVQLSYAKGMEAQ